MEVVAAKVRYETGRRFGRLAIVCEASPLIHFNEKNHRIAIRRFECRCDCGTEKIVRMTSLQSGSTLSCGCYHNELSVSQARRHGHASHTAPAPEYMAWQNMKARCYRPSSHRFEHYGARGITVCDRWRNSYENFLADMGRKPSPEHSIDRIDNDGNYEPTNCHWALPIVQARNNSRNRHVRFKGRSIPLSEACELAGLPYGMVKARLRRGWSDEKALVK